MNKPGNNITPALFVLLFKMKAYSHNILVTKTNKASRFAESMDSFSIEKLILVLTHP
jgi:hypothetical protein